MGDTLWSSRDAPTSPASCFASRPRTQTTLSGEENLSRLSLLSCAVLSVVAASRWLHVGSWRMKQIFQPIGLSVQLRSRPPSSSSSRCCSWRVTAERKAAWHNGGEMWRHGEAEVITGAWDGILLLFLLALPRLRLPPPPYPQQQLAREVINLRRQLYYLSIRNVVCEFLEAEPEMFPQGTGWDCDSHEWQL